MPDQLKRSISMRQCTQYIFTVVTFLGLAVTAQAQDDIILKAMKDEMARSMEDLRIDGKEKPFYIAYGVQDFKIFSTFATLGALLRSSEDASRGKSVRVLAGSYKFNDESMDNDLFSDPGAIDIEMPITDDYYGVRRALWASTDAVYKGAARKFQRHQQTLREKNQTLESIPHRTFAMVKPVTKTETKMFVPVASSQWDEYVKTLSAIFKDYPEIANSNASINFIYGHQYFVNSEGTTLKLPYQVAILQVNAQIKNENGEAGFDQIVRYARTIEELPSVKQMEKEVKSMTERLIASMQKPVLDEAYNGPVLFSGRAVAEIFQALLFNDREGLIASNTIQTPNEYRPEISAALDNKIGKSIIDPSITVVAQPVLSTFQGEHLLGHFQVDSEGVVPPDELVLIDKGILRELLNDRTITDSSQRANGHADGPGVIKISSDNTVERTQMKQRLIDLVANEGLEYGLLVDDDLGGRMGVANVYKVYPDGREELYRYARISRLSIRSLRKIETVSNTTEVHHLQAGNTQICSFIVPDAILINDMDFEPLRMPFFKDESYVASPLKKSVQSDSRN